MTRINWDEVKELRRLDEIIVYSILTLREAYTAPNNDDLDVPTKNDIADWIQWGIGYDEAGRAYFRYAAMLYLVDKHPMGEGDFLQLIVAPTKWLVRHKALAVDKRNGDTSLAIDTTADLPPAVDTLERLLFWAIVLAEWWNRVLTYLLNADLDPLPDFTWGNVPDLPAQSGVTTDAIDAQFDDYNGSVPDELPDFLQQLLGSGDTKGIGDFAQQIDLPTRDAGTYRENLVTCEEQDPKVVNYSQQQLDTLLPK